MVRIGLTICLIFVTAAGPWLCCCTAAQMAALASRSNRPANQVPVSCCCDTAASAEDQARESPSSPERHCPCQEGRPTAAVAALAKPVVSGEYETSAAALSFAVVPVDGLHAVAVSGASVKPTTVWPFLSGRDLLSRCHILRC